MLSNLTQKGKRSKSYKIKNCRHKT